MPLTEIVSTLIILNIFMCGSVFKHLTQLWPSFALKCVAILLQFAHMLVMIKTFY